MKDITLSTINQFTKLEIIAFVREKLLTQNMQSVKYSGARAKCLYRGPNGLKCAVGHLIADDEYGAFMEACTINASCFDKFEISHDRRRLLTRLQDIHDSRDPGHWIKDFAVVESDYIWMEKNEKEAKS